MNKKPFHPPYSRRKDIQPSFLPCPALPFKGNRPFSADRSQLSRIFISSLVYPKARLHQVTQSRSVLQSLTWLSRHIGRNSELWNCFRTPRLFCHSLVSQYTSFCRIHSNEWNGVQSDYGAFSVKLNYDKGAYCSNCLSESSRSIRIQQERISHVHF